MKGSFALLIALLVTVQYPHAVLAQAGAHRAMTGSRDSSLARPTLRAGTLLGHIQLDGVLDEPSWGAADSIENLTQIEPREGSVPAARTVVRVLASGREIIIGVRAEYPEGVGLVSFARQRDASLSSEDHIRVVLDTYRDGRSGYVFSINPNGARYDALVSNQGEGENGNWDAVWEAATSRTPTRWSAEISIPVRSLLFAEGLDSWGFNVERRIQRLQETDRWASPERDYKLTQTSRAGLLAGLQRFDLGLGLSVRPSVTAGAGIPARGAPLENEQDLSLDATQRLGGNTLASLTVNTDFAETEVDTRRTNLSRFPLFFPEKRTFFLEGSDIFEFGIGLNEDVRPFFSRRLGLFEGREVPIDVGGKVSGRLGSTNFGALVVRTDDIPGLVPRSTMGVLRVKQNVLRESSIGMISTFGDPQQIGDSWLGGADFTYQTSRFRGDKNFLVGLWGAAMDRDALDGRKTAMGIKADYPNDLWDIAFTYKTLGDAFHPSLGFVPRPGVRIVNFNVNYAPRPTRPIAGLRVRQMFHELLNRLVTDQGGRWESYRIFTAPINWRLESGDRFEANIVPTGERLTEAFEIADGVIIPGGSYHWNRYRLEAGLASKRRFSGQLSWWFGDFYGGSLDEIELTAVWRPSALFIVEMFGEHNAGRLPQGQFTQELVGTRLRVNVSPDLQLNSLVQYDNESQSFGTNTRLRWTFHPLGDLFVVYNHNLVRSDFGSGDRSPNGLRDRRFGFASNELLVKAQYTFRY
ncbi:MAG: carbohydrate binding family 9 domain-containing protein [Gemmatimonadota bacterium]|nr:carbohydrate binding family 9 domain-containing protein [Gemmatimonadota bacterium]